MKASKERFYFWRKTNNALVKLLFLVSWRRYGHVVSNGEAEVDDLDGIIQTDPGFFVETKKQAQPVKFTNSCGSGDTSS
jgi:hypothetical protein